MGKIANKKSLIVIASVVLCIAIVYGISLFMGEKTVQASVSPLEVEEGQPVLYADSTINAKRWLWEFGNGDTSEQKNGKYVFNQVGRHQVRLTVDGKYEKRFLVNVLPRKISDGSEELIKIDAPDVALQDEIITVHGIGNAKEWRWEFGATGAVDSRDRDALYAYTEPGTYEILLSTENTQYPIRHTIKIEPNFLASDSTDVLTLIGNDIRQKLQAIVDERSFNSNYNYILSTYLCDNPEVLVTVNGEKHNDFYSYCQGLRIVGRKKLIIDNVIVDIGDAQTNECVKRLLITQYEKFQSNK